jgi:hypothetical protein
MTGATAELQVEFASRLPGGRTEVFVLLAGAAIFSDTPNLASEKSRASFIRKLAAKVPALDAGQVERLEQSLVQLAHNASKNPAAEAPASYPQTASPSQMRDAAADETLGPVPDIIVSDRQLRHVVNAAWDALLAGGDPAVPALFVRDRSAVWVATAGCPKILLVTEQQMAGRLARRANWYRQTNEGLAAVMPPLRVARDMVEIASPDLMPLDSIVATPIFSASGALLTDAGYHATDRVILHQPLAVATVPPAPTEEDVLLARALLDELYHDFPFATPADRAQAIGACVLPFVRRLVQGVTPLHSFEAHSPGSGKNLLQTVSLLPSAGLSVPTHPFPTSEHETRKVITSILSEGPSVVLLDNSAQGREINSPNMAALLTTPSWSDRILGISRIVHLPNETMWLMTGNNPSFSMELARRTVRIRLDPKQDRPWERADFRHALPEWAIEHRSELAHALLVLVQNWIAKGRPRGPARLGSFERWSDVVGGIVTAAGYPGFLGNREEIYRIADTETSAWGAFTTVWWDAHGSNPQTVGGLRALCSSHHVLLEVLGDGNEHSQLTKLGAALVTQRDRSYSGLRIEIAKDAGHKGKHYRLTKADSPGDIRDELLPGERQGALLLEGPPSQPLAETDSCEDGGALGGLESDPATEWLQNTHNDRDSVLDADASSDPPPSEPPAPQGPPPVPADAGATSYAGSLVDAEAPQHPRQVPDGTRERVHGRVLAPRRSGISLEQVEQAEGELERAVNASSGGEIESAKRNLASLVGDERAAAVLAELQLVQGVDSHA